MTTRRTALAAWCVYVTGAAALTLVAAIVGPGIWPRVGDAGDPLAWIAFGMAIVLVTLSRVLPARVGPSPGASVQTMAVARSLVATSLNGSMALLAPIAWLASGNMAALAALAISLVGLVAAFPSERRWTKACRTIAAAYGQELATNASTTPPRPSRKVMALVAVMTLGAAALPVLVGNIFWTEVVLRMPSSPASRALVLVILATMMIGLAGVRFVGASASKRPRSQRAYGVMLLAFAGYLLFQGIRGF